MKTIKIGGQLETSAISLGCMRIGSLQRAEVANLIKTALDSGVNFFDHADIYGGGEAETTFAQAIADESIPREKIFIQTKGGIKQGQFDFSKEHIISALDKSLQRLKTDYADVFLLHRPDTLFEPEEVAEAFETLHKAGKAKYFGVSNQNPGQIQLLQKYLNVKIIANQLQFSPAHTGIIDAGFNVNMTNPASVNHDGGILEFCRLEDITIQAWSPFLYGFFEGVFLGSPKFPELNKAIDELAQAKNVTPEAIVVAWILRHPAKIQPIPGTTKADRLKSMTAAYSIEISRQEWYNIYTAAGNKLP
ncbi:MAG: aldo/keto reductase [Firmicutes bacterium]|nr:aldo/keto reductase [Bacillota bacterium]